jgi:transcriptional regulator with XRE-family HTH domain
MASLGQELKKEREARNISIEEMATATKIVGRYLKALEEDRLGDMPGGFFIKGIIRTYVRYLGLDEEAVLARYEEAGFLETPARNRGGAAGDIKFSLPDAKRNNRILVYAVIGAALIIILLALMFLWRAHRPRPRTKPASQAAVVIPQAEPYSPPPAEKPPAEPAQTEVKQEEQKGLAMDISFQAETWMQVFTDGKPKVTGLFPAGQEVRIEAEREIRIDVGNAGGLTFQLNGKPGRALGKLGQVITNIRITTDNFKDFLRPDEPAETSH